MEASVFAITVLGPLAFAVFMALKYRYPKSDIGRVTLHDLATANDTGQ